MDADTFVAAVEHDAATELDRLGSEKFLVAATEADLSATAVLRAAARSEAAARDTFDAWAAEERDAAAREAFAATATRESDHHDRVVAALDGGAEPPSDATPDPMHEHLREVTGTIERVGAGLVGRPLVADRTLLQVVNFFVNEADPARADLFRDLRADTAETRARGATLLEERCEADADWERAREAATAVIRVAYEDYADTLDGMGLDPRPLC
ncbi:MAG: rubrerythrin family protein [Halobacteriaceae archaeon]